MKLFGLVGYPLGHSFSKKYFEKKFLSEHIQNVDFLNFELENIENLHRLIHENEKLTGFTVTIPHKVSILPFMDEITDEVKKIGALNVVKINRQNNKIHLTGYNTDVYGFEKSLLEQIEPNHTQALVLGTGGSANAVGFVLKKLGINCLFVSRSTKDENTISYSNLTEEIIHSCLLIINTTPLGMFPEVETCPNIPYQYLTDKHFLFDLVYNPEQTLFMQKGTEQGARVCNGYDMLCYQAEEAWEIWNK